MMKKVLAGTVALVIASAGLALAQSTPPRDGLGWRPSAEDAAAMTDARIAGLKAGLKLTAEQEKNWPAVETAIRDLAKQRADRMKEFADRMTARRDARRSDNAPPAPDTIDRLRRGADRLTKGAESMRKLADAAEPLYKSLDDGQKRRFSFLLRMGGRPGGPHFWQRRAENAR